MLMHYFDFKMRRLVCHCYYCRAMLYAIVAFVDSDCGDWVPLKWVVHLDGSELSDVRSLINNHVVVRVYWPPSANPSAVSRARNRFVDREISWPSFNARILGTASLYHFLTLYGLFCLLVWAIWFFQFLCIKTDWSKTRFSLATVSAILKQFHCSFSHLIKHLRLTHRNWMDKFYWM